MKRRPLTLDYGRLGSKRRDPDQRLIRNISAAAQAGDNLWLASDEGKTIERLSWNGRRFADAVSFDLADYFALPRGSAEVDVEALSIAGRHLWIAGSHSYVRTPPQKRGDPNDPADAGGSADPLVRMAKIRMRRRRYLLGRLALTADGADIASPADRTAPCLRFNTAGNSLTRAMRHDEHLARFLTLPDKENGLDIEGLAAKGNRLLLGLRGPVIRGFAIVLEIAVKEKNGALRLAAIGPRGRRYCKHFLGLGGLGIRDLAAVGEDVVMIAGPTMGLCGPWAFLRWRRAFRRTAEGIVDPDAIRPLLQIAPHGDERPEVLTQLRHPNGRRGWLIVYDTPWPKRITKGGRYSADFVA